MQIISQTPPTKLIFMLYIVQSSCPAAIQWIGEYSFRISSLNLYQRIP